MDSRHDSPKSSAEADSDGRFVDRDLMQTSGVRVLHAALGEAIERGDVVMARACSENLFELFAHCGVDISDKEYVRGQLRRVLERLKIDPSEIWP